MKLIAHKPPQTDWETNGLPAEAWLEDSPARNRFQLRTWDESPVVEWLRTVWEYVKYLRNKRKQEKNQ